MHKRWFVIIMLVLLTALQARLWFGKNSIADYRKMDAQVQELKRQNANLEQRNSLLKADISDLQLGLESIEERARNELGLIKEGETFYRILPQEK
ncbi:cell division protein FtsB [Glaciecola sp. MH2013]|uniref:cell division protein FtsB n=1 Tax=Glaciecola sp. MH2013 TaxID=2785524 RepID=UPI00189DD380|nr:cell division protein FtsB [Glaciecola sp. MH2013]MBF7071853.1 cell division protein FtsB [Glaciecola sp. MH2013]